MMYLACIFRINLHHRNKDVETILRLYLSFMNLLFCTRLEYKNRLVCWKQNIHQYSYER